MSERYITRLERAKEKACPYGVAEKCLGDGCAAWAPGSVFESEITGRPHVWPKESWWERIFGGGVIRIAPMVRGVEHGHCARVPE